MMLRIVGVVALLGGAFGQALACSCAGPGTVCNSAGQSAAVFTGTVLAVAVEQATVTPQQQAGDFGGRMPANRISSNGVQPLLEPGVRRFRFRVLEVLSGVPAGQSETEIVTGFGGGDCGYDFKVGDDYVVYAYKDAKGRLATGMCSRTRPVAAAAEDVAYIRKMASMAPTSQLSVRTGFPDSPGPAGVGVRVEGPGGPYLAQTNAQGIASFRELPAGEYVIYQESDGRLPDSPRVTIYPKGCVDTILWRKLWLKGRVTTGDGRPAARLLVEAQSTGGREEGRGMTNADGQYELSVARAGAYRLGVNLSHSPTREAPYPAWFYPGTKDPAAAFVVEFAGRPETRTFDLTLPAEQAPREVRGVVVTKEGLPASSIRVNLLDENGGFVASEIGDRDGRFRLTGYAGIAYMLHAVRLDGNSKAMSAVPVRIPPGNEAVELRMIVDQPGNSYLDRMNKLR